MSENDFDWLDVLKGIAFVGGAIGLGYLAAKDASETVEKLLRLNPNQAAGELIHLVPKMSNEQWNLFQTALSTQANYSSHANNIYHIALYIRKSDIQIDEILSQFNIQDAVIMVKGLLANRNDFEQAVFAAVLYLKSQSNLKAESILGYLKQSYKIE